MQQQHNPHQHMMQHQQQQMAMAHQMSQQMGMQAANMTAMQMQMGMGMQQQMQQQPMQQQQQQPPQQQTAVQQAMDGIPTLANAPRCDLSAIPVGVMAGLVKIALTAGHEPWKPLDVANIPSLTPAVIEPGESQ